MYFREYVCRFSRKLHYFCILGVSHLNTYMDLRWVRPHGTTWLAQHNFPAKDSSYLRDAHFSCWKVCSKPHSSDSFSGSKVRRPVMVLIWMPRNTNCWQGSTPFFQLIWKPRSRNLRMRASYVALQDRKSGSHTKKVIQVNHHIMAGLAQGTCHSLGNAVENCWGFEGFKWEAGVTHGEGLFLAWKLPL